MKKSLFLLATLLVASCSSAGVPFSETEKALPKLTKKQSRLVFYQGCDMEAAIAPLLLDKKKVADVSNGNVAVETVYMGKHTLSTVGAGSPAKLVLYTGSREELYIKLSSVSGKPQLTLVDDLRARAELKSSCYKKAM